MDTPKGWRKAECWTNGAEFVILGNPPSEELIGAEAALDDHNCDSMGCRQSHVLVRGVYSGKGEL